MKEKVRIGAGASFATDRIEPAVELAEKGEIDYLVFECLAERTIALAQLKKLEVPDLGYNEMLEERWLAVLELCKKKGIKIITSMGAANPIGALKKTCEIIRRLKIGPMKVAAVTGDDVLNYVLQHNTELKLMETGKPLSSLEGEIVSANVYLGAGPIVDALAGKAEIVITGRVADPSLFLAAMIYEFGWRMDDWLTLGAGQAAADMVECAASCCGGTFADPGYKEVKDLARLGFPLIEVRPDGSTLITKVEGTGGIVSVATCTEHLIYEIHDPANYITPDVIVDFTGVELTQIGPDLVQMTGAAGKVAPDLLKVSVGIKEGYIGEGEITYAGLGCLERAKLAENIVRERIEIANIKLDELRVDYIGLNSLHQSASLPPACAPYEVRLRFAGRTRKKEDANRLGNEIETLVGKGPASSCMPRKYVREVLAVYSVLIPRDVTHPKVTFMEVLQ
jgi:hypothetical protein